MGKDEGAAVLLEAAALTYARAIEAWRAGFPLRADVTAQAEAQAAELQRAIDEARAQLLDAAVRVGLASGEHYADLYSVANSPAPWKLIAHQARSNNRANMERDGRLASEPGSPHMGIFYWLALAGEVGEGCNLVKKLWRDGERMTLAQKEENGRAVREELCDVRIYVEALADLYGMDLDAECEKKMRRVMERPFAQPAKRG